jgi:hypothetical protein
MNIISNHIYDNDDWLTYEIKTKQDVIQLSIDNTRIYSEDYGISLFRENNKNREKKFS